MKTQSERLVAVDTLLEETMQRIREAEKKLDSGKADAEQTRVSSGLIKHRLKVVEAAQVNMKLSRKPDTKAQ